MDNGITLGSLFDGIGGFPLCAVLSGITPVWAAEIEPACIAVTKQHFPDMLHLGDISQVNGAEIPPVDIITFGSPCQDLSVAGKRAGIKHEGNGDDETTRSGLFFEAIRIIYEMRRATNGKYPTFIVWENVPGAFSSHNGHDFRTVLEEITKADIPMPASGKWANAGVVRGDAICAAWRLFDAQYWGVPQRRKRIYLVGSFGSNCAEEILFKRDSVRRYLTKSGAQGESASRSIGTGVAGGDCGEKSDNIDRKIYRRLQRNSKRTGNCGANRRSEYIFDARGNGDGITVPTITGDHCHRINDYCAVVLQAKGFPLGFRAENTKCYDEKATTLCNGTRPGFCNGVMYQVAAFNGQNSISAAGVELKNEQAPTLTMKKNVDVIYALQGSMIGREDKNGPQGDGINENVCFTLNTVDKHAIAYSIDCRNGKINEELNGTLQAHTGHGFSLNTNIVTMFKFVEWIVRRLTPLECERLQGYPDCWTVIRKIEDMTEKEYEFFKDAFLLDKEIKAQSQLNDIYAEIEESDKEAVEKLLIKANAITERLEKIKKKPPTKASLLKWYNKLDCDGTRYKQTGNSLAIPCALRVIGYIADYIRERVKE